MNKKTTYEVLIAEKVNQVPVPDMADAIWAKIELELDAAPGTDGSEQQAPSEGLSANTMTVATKVWLAVIAVAVIAVLIILFVKNHRKEKPAELKNVSAILQPKEETQEEDSVTHTINAIPGTKDVPLLPVQQKTGNASSPVISPALNDSIFNEPLKNNRIDSGISVNNPPPIIKRDSSATIPPYKKPRGVKGIEDGDYKISSKKDSLKN